MQNEYNRSLAKEYAELKTIVDEMQIGTWQVNLQTGEASFNSTCFSLLGYLQGEVEMNSYQDWMRFRHPDCNDFSLLQIENYFLSNKNYFEFELRMLHKAGHCLALLNRVKVHKTTGNGKPLIVGGTCQNISNQKLIENRLNHAQTLTKTGNWEFNLQTKELFWSIENYAIFEIDINTPKNELIEICKSKYLPEELKQINELKEKSLLTGASINFEHKIIFPDGRVKNVISFIELIKNDIGVPCAFRGTVQDITERKQQEEIKNRKLVDAQNIAKIGSWEFYLETKEQYWSEQHYKIFELDETNPENLYEAYRSRIHPDDLPVMDAKTEALVSKGEELVYEHRVVFPDGRMKYVLGLGSPIRDKDGSIIGIRGTVQDITERKLKELEIVALKDNLYKTSELAKIGSWEYCPVTKKLVWSEITKKIHEVSANYEPDFETAISFYKEGKSRDQIRFLANRAVNIGKPYDVELEIVTANGREKWVRAVCQVEAAGDKGYKIFGTIQDVDDQKRQHLNNQLLDSRLKYAMEATGDGLWDWNPITQSLYYSKRWLEMIGYVEGELSTGEVEWISRIHPEDKARVLEEINNNIIGLIDSFNHTYRFLHKNGQYIMVQNRGKVVERDYQWKAIRLIGTHTDITAQKIREQRIQQIEARWQFAINSAGHGLWDWDIEKNKTFFSKQWLSILGFKENELTNSIDEWKDRLHPEDHNRVMRQLQPCLENASDRYASEHRMICKDGTIKWVQDKGKVLERDSKGNALRMIGTITDLTDRKIQEDNVIRLKNELQSFFDLTNDFMCIANVNGTFKKVNSTFIKELGYEEHELINVPFVNFIHPNDVAATLAEVEKLAKGALTIDFENRYRCKNGEYIWLSWRTTPDIQTGLLYANARNITSKKTQDLELKLALKSVQDYQKALNHVAIVGVTDIKGDIIFANNKFVEISGYSKEELFGQNHRILKSGFHPEEFFIDMWRQISLGNTWKGEVCNKNKKGQFYWVDTVIVPFLDNEGKPIQYFSIRIDITERKRQEDLKQKNLELQKSKDLAERVAKLKGQFLANMSHEIRTPMNAVLGITALLKKSEFLNKKEKRYLEIISLNSKNLMAIINDILDFSRIESGRIELANNSFNLKVKLIQLVDSLAQLAHEKNLHIEMHLPPKFHENVIGDELRLSQIIINLLSNGIKFTEQGKVILSLQVISENEQEIRLRIGVKDTGVGIPEEKQSEIFESFTQAKNDATRKYGGIGLGLSMAKKLVDLHGGKIIVVSEEGSGSEFSFEITYKKCLTTNCLEEGENNQNKEKHLPDDTKILLVEDNEFNRLVALDTINEKYPNIKVDFAENGLLALEKLKANNYHVILMDIQMPEMDGHTATSIIRNELKLNVPIVAMTAHAHKTEIDFCFKNGMNFYVPKPFDSDLLYSTLGEAVDMNKQLVKESNKKTAPIQSNRAIQFIEGKNVNTLPNQMSTNGKEMLDEGIVNKNSIIEFTNGSKVRIVKMIEMFLRDTPLEVYKLKEFYASGNMDGLKNLAHSFKPKYTYMGMPQLSEIAKKIENNCKEQINFDETKLLIERLEKQTELAREELKNILSFYL